MTKKVIFDERQKDSFSFLCGGADTVARRVRQQNIGLLRPDDPGEITDIDGTAVTMQLGELSAGGMPSHDVSDSSDSGQTPPDKLDGETQSGNSSSQDHASSDSSQPPAKPDSQSGDSGSQPPEKPDGEAPSGTPGGMGSSSFTAGEESVTLDFADAEITKNDESIELSDLAEGDILFNGYTITLADDTVLK